MKKALIALGILLVIIGVVIVAVFGGKEGFFALADSYSVSHDFTTATHGQDYSQEESDLLNSVEITAKDYSVYICKSQDNVLSVKYPELNSGDVITCSSSIDNSGILTVTQSNNKNFFHIGHKNKSFMVVYVPRHKTAISVTVKTQVGKVDVSDFTCDNFTYEGKTGGLLLDNCTVVSKLDAKSSTGAISVNNCTLNEVSLFATTGAISVEKVSCSNLKVDTNTGVVTADFVTADYEVKINSDTGLINFNGKSQKATLSTNTGAINFEITADVIDVSTSTGAINGDIHGVQKDYNITVEKSIGKCNLVNQTAGSSKYLTAKVSTGSINIDFVK